ncbi:putative dTDP-6-deoxy-4-ketoglucose epimerase [Actinoplanes missouriensis 431]|uniref:Putative dTDP-6-deoxy-4-ketoglucose epimerase n=1 Tax=Actinoplanes missouriensis (strain ATCC 14538 / DSM 43046 / CBS 188.64 / JCM 3121 / NBRC 102363 / NCIMB 12654 / NRRL B-3342 / UNCC 431) TaxID=512565 RepID=I0H3R9_ACTM4|nr:dTDP-4-dehydrorhamnose 3,5-epimerase [Actinoplanes missouriensis]BAL87656.1 putative dTDP-6-deoxy-4-ketoglucose epimerase [Actinoplanes missouriensis 431]
MKISPLGIEGAFEITPVQHGDARGSFLEWYRFDHLAEAVGHPLDLAQGNLSVSARDVVRGIHFADVPPGQAKYVTCVKGAVLDVIVDIRVGSPTFGRWESVRLDDEDRKAVYLGEGLGHGFCALTEGATVAYLCSTEYRPGREHGIHPLDPTLGIAWPAETPLLSGKDAQAPSLEEARDKGLLPRYEECQNYAESLRRNHYSRTS